MMEVKLQSNSEISNSETIVEGRLLQLAGEINCPVIETKWTELQSNRGI